MRLAKLEHNAEKVLMRYRTTYRMSWSRVLDFAQVFFEDVKAYRTNIAYMEALDDKETKIPVQQLKDGLFCRTVAFIAEHHAVSVSGYSNALKTDVSMTFYNDTDIIDVEITRNGCIEKDFMKDTHTLDKYMDGIEVHSVVRDAQRQAINLFGSVMAYGDEQEASLFGSMCNSLGAIPFPEKKEAPSDIQD